MRSNNPCDQHVLEALDLAERLLRLAEEGIGDAQDDSCAVMYGVMRDCGYRIRELAQREQRRHHLTMHPNTQASA